MFQKIADAGAVVRLAVFSNCLFHRFAQHTAQDALVAELTAEAGNSPQRCVLHIEVHSEEITAVVVVVLVPVGAIGSTVTYQLKLVVVSTPVDMGCHFQFPGCFSLKR